MARQSTHHRNGYAIVATAAGLVLLVAFALSWLGWRLLEQEESLQRQHAQSRLEQRADALLTGFLRRIEERKAWLSQLGSSLPPGAATPRPPDAGGILVSFSGSRIEVQPAGQLLYYPDAPRPPTFDSSLFEQALKLEFQTLDLEAAASGLAALAASNDAGVRAEALLRLARVQKKSGRIPEALATYAKLQDETLIGLSEQPYGLSSRLARCELLASLSESEKARREALALLDSLEAGRWIITRETFAWLYPKVRHLAGMSSDSKAPDVKLAIAHAVESAWAEWQLLQRSGVRSVTRPWHESGPVAVLGVMDANAERMVSLIYAGDAMRHLGLEEASLTDPNGHTIFGAPLESASPRVTQSLAPAGFPWQLHVSAPAESTGAFSKERRNYFVFVLALIVALVSLACYAMARGVLREAAAVRLQSDFVSAVSHEFRSPLTTLRQLTELLAEERIHDERRRLQYFRVLQQETSRLHHLVEDLLDFGRSDAGRRPYRLEPIDFSELVRDGIEDYQKHADSNGHAIELSSNSSQLLVEADREAMRRVVRNLLENAVKYSPEATTVWVETGCEDRTAVLRVRDEGIGIPPEETGHIFEKFVRGEAARKACIPGVGIGLAMVREIVRVHHGAVDLTSKVGRGSTFTVRLPLRSLQ